MQRKKKKLMSLIQLTILLRVLQELSLTVFWDVKLLKHKLKGKS